MKTPFVKMHGAGNDFILIDDRALTFPWQDYMRMAALAMRRLGIGCEGIILVQPSDKADFRMRFLNPDGTEVELCGNGARCCAHFAHSLGMVGKSMTIETMVGLIDAEISSEGVTIWMPEPSNRRYDLAVQVEGRNFEGHSLAVGAPHFVVSVPDLSTLDVERYGSQLRQHKSFAPAGINVSFIKQTAVNRLSLRTYERGVEAESGACGTGAVAAAVVSIERGTATLPLTITTSSGFELKVDGDWRTRKCTGMTLTGPAKVVFEGVIDLDTVSLEDGNE